VSAQESTGSISGFVYEADGETPIEDVFVWFDGGDPYRGGECTDADGGFTITNIPFDVEGLLMAPKGFGQGNYLCNGEEFHYVAEYWQETPGGNSATRVRLSASTPMRDDIVFTLEHGGSISGTVYDAAGDLPFPGVTLWVNWWGEDGDGSIVGGACSDDDGNFLIENIPFGVDLIVQVMGGLPWTCGGSAEYVNAVWGESWSNPTYVRLDAASPSYNTIVFRIERTGTISGVVTDSAAPSPHPIPDVQVCANRSETGWDGDCTHTDTDGTYRSGLPVGEYRVDAQADGWRREFYNDVYDGSAATLVSVVAEQETSSINFALDRPYYIEASLTGNWVHARGWPIGTGITMTISGSGGDYTATATMGQAPWNPGDPNDIVADFGWPDSFELRPGDVITMTGGDGSKTLVISPLQVLALDQQDETVSGEATPGSQVQVCANIPGRCISRYVTAASEPSGDWIASYSVAGVPPDDADTFDLQPGSNGWAMERDEDGDQTWVDWRVPSPNFSVRASNDQVEGWEWTQGDTVTLEIDDPDTLGDPNYATTETVGLAPWDPNQTYVSFNLWGVYDIQPGDVVSMSHDSTTKTTTVSDLAFTDLNVDADTVSGIAGPGLRVNVWACDASSCTNRHVNANSGGTWVADFAHPGVEGDEQNTFNIVRGSWVDSSQVDEDGDSTMFGQNVPNPYVEASPAGNWVHAREWPIGTEITMTISGSGGDYSATATMGQAPWNPGDPNDIVADFDLHGYDIQPGDIITATGDGTSKTLIVSQLEVTGFDLQAETLSGVGTSGVQIQVCANLPNGCISRWVTPGYSGLWTANYGIAGVPPDDLDAFDIKPGSNGWAAEYEADSDRTWVDWRVPNPRFTVFPEWEYVEAYDWPDGARVTVTTEISGCSAEGVAAYPEWDPWTTFVGINLPEGCDIQAGDLVTLTDGTTTKTHDVTTLAVTFVDPEANTVTGGAEPDSQVHVWDHGTGRQVWPTADLQGTWIANFAGILDIVPGMAGRSEQTDEDGDATAVDWVTPWPPLPLHMAVYGDDSSYPIRDYVVGINWPEGTEVTLTIDDPDPQVSPEYTASQTAVTLPAGYQRDLYPGVNTMVRFFLEGAYDLQPGDIVTLAGGNVSRTHTVGTLSIASVDPETYVVSGTSTPGSSVEVVIFCSALGGDRCSVRREVVDVSGSWVADFSAAGDEPGETEWNTTTGTYGNAFLADDDGDETRVAFAVPASPPEGFVPSSEVQVSAGSPIQVVASLPLSGDLGSTGESLLHAVEMAVEDYGTILGFALQLNSEDSGCDFWEGAEAARRVVSNESNVGTIGPYCSVSFVGGLPIYEVAGVAAVSGSSTLDITPGYGPSVSNRTISDEIARESAVWVPELQTLAPVQAWRDRYEDQFGAPPDDWAVLYYDAARLLFTRIEQVALPGPDGGLTIDRAALAVAVRNTAQYYGVSGCISLDRRGDRIPIGPDVDGDCVLDGIDNAPSVFNPDQRDIDGDGFADVGDACPSDPSNNCDASGSAAKSIGPQGGTVDAPDGSVSMGVPKGALEVHTSLSITDLGSGFLVTTDQGQIQAVIAADIGPGGTTFADPVTITFHWQDADNDGVVDGTTIPEAALLISKDGLVVAGPCSIDAGCDMGPNTFSVQVIGLSRFVLGAPTNRPPVADAGPDQGVNEGATVALSGAASGDPDGDALTFEWDLDNDGQYDDDAGVTTSVTFPDDGTFMVGLRVTDPGSLSATDTVQITVTNVSPVVDTLQATVNNLRVLTGTGSFVDPGADTWTATVNYGDGTGTRNLTLNPDKSFSLRHTYARNGTYTVQVCVRDDGGGSGCGQTQVTALFNRPPVANAGGPYFTTEGSSITLNASRSTDPDHNIVLYEWDLDSDSQFDDATGVRPAFVALDNGVFTVRVRVTDAGGLSSIATATVTVRNSPPVITSITITSPVRVGTVVNARAVFTDAGVHDTFTATWNWGDGSTTSGSISNYAVTGSHTYTRQGTYLVTITITDKDGGVARASKAVVVSRR
jgi:ABC-type branched-subunit amino acid transport system substrate-binding protein